MRASMKRAANPIIAPVYHLLVWLENPFCFLFKKLIYLSMAFVVYPLYPVFELANCEASFSLKIEHVLYLQVKLRQKMMFLLP